MLTTFDIAQPNKKLNLDNDSIKRMLGYQGYRAMYESDFKSAFPNTVLKIQKKYPLENTTAQTLIELNLFYALTDFFKFLMTNQGLDINVDESQQAKWGEIETNNNFITVLKEVFIDNSRFGNGLFKVILNEDKPQIFSVCPDCWFPVFEKGNLNALEGHVLIYDLEDMVNGRVRKLKRIEYIYKGKTENELWTIKNGALKDKLDIEAELGIKEIDDYSSKWNDFIIFPVKNTTESDKYFGDSDYKRCKSIVEEIMLTVSQNSKIINRHANPKLAGSEEALEVDPKTGKKGLPDNEFYRIGRDGKIPAYITADLQADAIKQHIDTLMQFFYIMTKTPPQAYGLDIAGNMSGESLRKIFMSALAKADDIKQVSFESTIKKVIECAMAFNGSPIKEVKINWGTPIPEDYSEQVINSDNRVLAGTQSKLSAIMTLDNVDEETAKKELAQIESEKKAETITALDNLYPSDNTVVE